MIIILDLDGTLINEISMPEDRLKARPHIEDFLLTCFKLADKVILWTAAKREWYDFVYEAILKRVLFNIGHDFHEVLDYDFCEVNGKSVSKPLTKLFTHAAYGQFCNEKNTVILDNSPIICMNNKGNAIAISTYKTSLFHHDSDLLSAADVLKKTKKHYLEKGTVNAFNVIRIVPQRIVYSGYFMFAGSDFDSDDLDSDDQDVIW